jgi:hypothetical protein
MRRNLGETKLRKRRRNSSSMVEFDQMPRILRNWLNEAALPWRPKSVHRAYKKAFLRTGDPALALIDLDRVQQLRLSKGLRYNIENEIGAIEGKTIV